MISKTFCVIPWVHVAISTSGSFRPCCNVSYSKDDYSDGDHYGGFESLHYINKEDIKDVWNSDIYKNFRKMMIRGEKISACSRCYREEEAGIDSARINNNNLFHFPEIQEDGSCSLDSIQYIDVRLGNKCNLSCRMCNPFASNQWIDDERATHIRGVSEKDLAWIEQMDWFEGDIFWNNLISILDTCELLYFSGGEPTLFTGRKYKLFDKCIEKDIAKNIVLRYNTNITVLPPKLIEYWKYFKEVRVQCSIDGVGKVNDYIRHPIKWEIIDRNLRILHEKENIKLSVHTTPQMYNIFHLVELFEYLKQFNMFPYLNILNHPPHYNIKVLHKDQKEKVTHILTKWYEDNGSQHKKLMDVVNYMNKDDWSYLYDDFLNEAYALDKIRNQHLKDYIPQLRRDND